MGSFTHILYFGSSGAPSLLFFEQPKLLELTSNLDFYTLHSQNIKTKCRLCLGITIEIYSLCWKDHLFCLHIEISHLNDDAYHSENV